MTLDLTQMQGCVPGGLLPHYMCLDDEEGTVKDKGIWLCDKCKPTFCAHCGQELTATHSRDATCCVCGGSFHNGMHTHSS